MEIISLKAAKAAGLRHYFTGKPCKRGHIEQRLVSTRICEECGRQSSREWSRRPQAREFRRDTQRNRREIARNAGRKYYFTGKPCKRGHVDKRFVSSFLCMSCAREKAKEHWDTRDGTTREKRREYERRRRQDPTFQQAMQQYKQRPVELAKQRVRNRAWKKANRASCTDRQNKRHALLQTVFVENVSLEFLFERDKGRCQLCGYELSMATKWPDPKTPTRDHRVPLTKGGTHERSNLQLACAECNIRKGAKVA